MNRIEATFRISTPLFLGGADKHSRDLRLPSIKSTVRFWWRAVAWKRLGGNLKEIHREEAILFGSTETGESVFRFSLAPYQCKVLHKGGKLKDGNRVVGDGARYLGYGVIGAYGRTMGEVTRSCIQAPLDFTLQVLCRRPSVSKRRVLPNDYVEQLLDATKIMGLLGGLGSKSRKGYGSLSLLKLKHNEATVWCAPEDARSYRDTLRELILFSPSANLSNLPEYTALSETSRVLVIPSAEGDTSLSMLDKLGREFMRYRSWGRGAKLFGNKVKSEKIFEHDHDLMENVAKGEKPTTHPRRVVFGLPHNYGPKTIGDKKYSAVQVKPQGLERRGSPLFFHIHMAGEEPLGIVILIPSVFLPKRTKISVGRTTVNVNPNIWDDANAFMDRLLDSSQRKEISDAMEVTA